MVSLLLILNMLSPTVFIIDFEQVNVCLVRSDGKLNKAGSKIVMLCAIWYHLYNFKNVKNTHGEVLANQKVTVLHGYFLCFFNCTNGSKSHKASCIEIYNL